MNTKQIAITQLELALIRLNRLINEGTEFPEALYRATQLYKNVSSDQLQDAYDEHQLEHLFDQWLDQAKNNAVNDDD